MTLIPEAVYVAEIGDAVVKETRAGRYVLLITFRVTQGKYENCVVEGRWYVPFRKEQLDEYQQLEKDTAGKYAAMRWLYEPFPVRRDIVNPFNNLLKGLPALVDSAGVLDPTRVKGKAVNIRVYHKLNSAMQTVERVKDVTEVEVVSEDQIDAERFRQVESDEAASGKNVEAAEPIDSGRFAPAASRYEVETARPITPAEPLIDATEDDIDALDDMQMISANPVIRNAEGRLIVESGFVRSIKRVYTANSTPEDAEAKLKAARDKIPSLQEEVARLQKISDRVGNELERVRTRLDSTLILTDDPEPDQASPLFGRYEVDGTVEVASAVLRVGAVAAGEVVDGEGTVWTPLVKMPNEAELQARLQVARDEIPPLQEEIARIQVELYNLYNNEEPNARIKELEDEYARLEARLDTLLVLTDDIDDDSLRLPEFV